MLEALQILGLSATILFFIGWVLTLKKDVAAKRKEVDALQQMARDKSERELAARRSADQQRIDAAGSNKLWMVGDSK